MAKGNNITWQNINCTLGDLQPWSDNPRYSTKAQAKRLLESWTQLGQFQTIAVGPNFEVYDGHQRLSALLTIHSPSFTIDARQSSRELETFERQKLVVTAHVGTVGNWDWDKLAAYEPADLSDWGMDKDTLANWNNDAGNLALLLDIEEEQNPDASDGSLLDVVKITIAEPTHVVNKGDAFKFGNHVLVCENIIDGWANWVKFLKPETLLCCYSGPFVPLTERAKTKSLLLVQPDIFIAGHTLDRWSEIFPNEPIVKL